MSRHRSQGRPRRGESEVGKEKILIALRDILRSEQYHDLSRKTVAARAGVTPALISYYFPNKDQLLLEAATPVVTVYADEICNLAQNSSDINDNSQSIVAALIRMYKDDGRIIEIYRDFIGRTNNYPNDQIKRITSALSRTFDPNKKTSGAPDLDALVLQGAIWGVCRFAALAQQNAMIEDEVSRQEWLPARLTATFMSYIGLASSLTDSCALAPFSSAVG